MVTGVSGGRGRQRRKGDQEPDTEGEQTGHAGVNLCMLTCVFLKAEAESIILTGTILWKLKAADPGLVDQSPTGCGLQLITHSQGINQLLIPKAPHWNGGL